MVTKATARRYTRLSSTEWDTIISQYSTGVSTLAELATKYSCSIGAIMSQAKARGASRRGKGFSAAAALSFASAATASTISVLMGGGAKPSPASTAQERIAETRDTVYNDACAIQYLIRMAIAALPPPTTPAEAAATVRAAGEAVAALDRINRIRRVVLRLDKDNSDADLVLPVLPISVMTDAEIDQMRAQQLREDNEGDVADSIEADEGTEIVEEEGVTF